MTTDPMDPGYRYYPPEPDDVEEAEELYLSDEILCDACEATKEALVGTDTDERPWGSAIGCKACLAEAHDAIEREREEKEDLDRIRGN